MPQPSVCAWACASAMAWGPYHTRVNTWMFNIYTGSGFTAPGGRKDARTETPALLHLHHCEVQLAYGQVLPATRPRAQCVLMAKGENLYHPHMCSNYNALNRCSISFSNVASTDGCYASDRGGPRCSISFSTMASTDDCCASQPICFQ